MSKQIIREMIPNIFRPAKLELKLTRNIENICIKAYASLNLRLARVECYTIR